MHPILLFLIGVFLEMFQTTWLQVPAFSWIQVDLLLIFIVYIAYFRGAMMGLLFGMLLGFILDVNTGAYLGGQIFIYGVIGYFTGSFFGIFLNRYLFLFTITLMIVSVIELVMQFGLHQLFTAASLESYSNYLYKLISIGLREMIFNGVFALLTYPLASKWIAVRKRRSLMTEDA